MYHIQRKIATKIFHKIHDFSTGFSASSTSSGSQWKRPPHIMGRALCLPVVRVLIVNGRGRPIREKRKIHADGVASGFQRSL